MADEKFERGLGSKLRSGVEAQKLVIKQADQAEGGKQASLDMQAAMTGQLGTDWALPVTAKEPKGYQTHWDQRGVQYKEAGDVQKAEKEQEKKDAEGKKPQPGGGGVPQGPRTLHMSPEAMKMWADAQIQKTQAATAAIRPEDATVRDRGMGGADPNAGTDPETFSRNADMAREPPEWLQAYMRNRQ